MLDVQLGVGSVREHMDSRISKAEKFSKQKQAQASQASKLKQVLAYERGSDAGKKVKEQEAEVAHEKAKLQKLEAREAAGRQARQDQEADLEDKVCAHILTVHGFCRARVAVQLSASENCD